MKFEWQHGSRAGGDAQTVGEHLEAIRARHDGRLTAGAIVADARKTKSLLHGYFEWDDSIAAEKHREKQARDLVRFIVVRHEKSPTQEPIRWFVQVTEDETSHYTSIEHAMSESDLRAQVLHRALSEYESLNAKYRALAELAEVFDAVDRASMSVKTSKRRAPKRSQRAVAQMV